MLNKIKQGSPPLLTLLLLEKHVDELQYIGERCPNIYCWGVTIEAQIYEEPKLNVRKEELSCRKAVFVYVKYQYMVDSELFGTCSLGANRGGRCEQLRR